MKQIPINFAETRYTQEEADQKAKELFGPKAFAATGGTNKVPHIYLQIKDPGYMVLGWGISWHEALDRASRRIEKYRIVKETYEKWR